MIFKCAQPSEIFLGSKIPTTKGFETAISQMMVWAVSQSAMENLKAHRLQSLI